MAALMVGDWEPETGVSGAVTGAPAAGRMCANCRHYSTLFGREFCQRRALWKAPDETCHMHEWAVQEGIMTITSRNRRPFPNPIREAITLLQDRTIMRWLEWRSDPRWVSKINLVLVTKGEGKNKSKRVWGTWEPVNAAAVQQGLRKIGVKVEGGGAFRLDRWNGEEVQLWYLPNDGEAGN